MYGKAILRVLFLASASPVLPTAACGGGGSGPACKSNLLAGDLVVTEIMANPEGSDNGKEWFEIFNASSAQIDLTGVKLSASREDGTGETFHFVSRASIIPGQYMVFGGVLDEAKPAHVDYGTGADISSLRNSGGRISVTCNGAVVDQAVYVEMQEGVSQGFDGSKTPDAIANDNLGNWCPATIEYAPASFGSPGMANETCAGVVPPSKCKDLTGLRDLASPLGGDLVISELMPNPKAVDDRLGEWFEVYARRDVDLNGIQIGKTPGTVEATVQSLDCLRVAAGTYVVFARSADGSMNGGLPRVDHEVDVSLSNSNGSLFIGFADQVLDSVAYSSSRDGASSSLDPTMLDAALNDDPENWCPAADASVYGTGDRGTPGAANTSCGIVPEGKCYDLGSTRDKAPPVAGNLVVTEIMANPNKVDDSKGEWFEVYVNTGADLNGLQIGRQQGAPETTLPEGDCLWVTAGTYLLFARETDSLANGGLPMVDFQFGFSLTNSNGAIALEMGGFLLDAVAYGSSRDGAASSLDPAYMNPADNDVPGNWCAASFAYGSGDLGTPRAPNPSCR